MPSGVKSLPLADLEVVAVIYCAGADDEGRMDYELEVLNEDLKASSSFEPLIRDNLRCDCCGKRLKYACEVVHIPEKKGYYIGRQCASKITILSRFNFQIEGASVAMAERAACKHREMKFRQENPSACPALDWARLPHANRIAVDMLAKLRRWGSLSPAQVQFLIKLYSEDVARRSNVSAVMPTGRASIVGKVVSLKNNPEPARYGGTIDHWKMVVDLENGLKVWGTRPEALSDISVGDKISFSAQVQVSQKDPLFGFFKRPTQARKVS